MLCYLRAGCGIYQVNCPGLRRQGPAGKPGRVTAAVAAGLLMAPYGEGLVDDLMGRQEAPVLRSGTPGSWSRESARELQRQWAARGPAFAGVHQITDLHPRGLRAPSREQLASYSGDTLLMVSVQGSSILPGTLVWRLYFSWMLVEKASGRVLARGQLMEESESRTGPPRQMQLRLVQKAVARLVQHLR
jgi:hypothetical protein